MRIDGLLLTVGRYDAAAGRGIVTRLMVMGQLLTYRTDVPQEGRVRVAADGRGMDFRLAIMPTSHGLRAAVRTPAELLQSRGLADLGLPAGVTDVLERFAAADSGMLLVTGPAGSGKTSTIYALLERIVRTSEGVSIVALEDPVERDLPGVTQIEVRPFGELTYERALRSILRQDPQVLMLGEIRDAATASLAVQAALSGHRLVSTFHAGRPEQAMARLLEMGIEPYQVTSALFGVVSQRLVRRRQADGGYAGRAPVAEAVVMDDALRKEVLARGDANALRSSFQARPGYATMAAVASRLVEEGITDRDEIVRVLGPEAG
jgi:general secretion pathway protein E